MSAYTDAALAAAVGRATRAEADLAMAKALWAGDMRAARTAEAQVAKVREYAETLAHRKTAGAPDYTLSPTEQRRRAGAEHGRTIGYTLIGMLALGSVGATEGEAASPAETRSTPSGRPEGPGGTTGPSRAAEPEREDTRNPLCVAQWPECIEGAYDPHCCRFPKSCSCERPRADEPRACPRPEAHHYQPTRVDEGRA